MNNALKEKNVLCVYGDRTWPPAMTALTNDLRHVITWRRNTLDAVCSYIVGSFYTQQYGPFLFNQNKFEFTGNEKSYRTSYVTMHKEFVKTLNRLDRVKALMVEVNSMSTLYNIEWEDGLSLDIIDRNNADKFINEYTIVGTNKSIRPIDMLSEKTINLAAAMADDIEHQFDWENLDGWTGFKSYSD
jgi:hypothetical protein